MRLSASFANNVASFRRVFKSLTKASKQFARSCDASLRPSRTARVRARSAGRVAACDTVGETRELMREAIEIHLAGMREDGDPIPTPTVQVNYVDVAA